MSASATSATSVTISGRPLQGNASFVSGLGGIHIVDHTLREKVQSAPVVTSFISFLDTVPARVAA